MPSVTIPANGTRHISPSGCFAITKGTALDFDGIGVIKASSNDISIYWRVYDETVTPHQLIDHEEPPQASPSHLSPHVLGADMNGIQAPP